jgi:glycine cleavage system H protein
MSTENLPADRRYTKTHEWVKSDGEELLLGITDHAQSELTDIVFVELPPAGKKVEGGASALVLESVKTVADVYAPATGTVVSANSDLKAHPEYVNQDPYGKGWLLRLKPDAPFDPATLLTPEQYRAAVAAGTSH